MDISSGVRIGPFEVFLPTQSPVPSIRHNGHHPFPGRLFIVEGIDGSGKSTQLSLLHKWLEAKGYGVVFSEWNSSPLVKDTTKLGKKKKMLTPATFSLIHSTDFADRTEHSILPLLKAGAVVLCDRYIYTAFARDVARGMDRRMGARSLRVRGEAHRCILFPRPAGNRDRRVSPARATASNFTRPAWTWQLTDDSEESFRIFQGRILDEYEKMIPEFGLTVIDATLPVEAQQAQVRQIVSRILRTPRN